MEHLDLEFATKYLIVSFYYFQFLHQKLLMWFTEAVWRRSNRKSSYFKNLISKKSMILLNNFNSSTKYIFYKGTFGTKAFEKLIMGFELIK